VVAELSGDLTEDDIIHATFESPELDWKGVAR
jgi:hypothetical protein